MRQFVRNIAYLFAKLFFGSKVTTFISEKLMQFAYFLRAEVWYRIETPISKERTELYDYITSSEGFKESSFGYLEFGVSKGSSMRQWVKHCQNSSAEFFGFDTFEGLPEDWGNVKKGAYSADGKTPNIDDPRIRYYIGLVQDTLPQFIKENSELLKRQIVIHLDLDLYNATLITLLEMKPFMKKGDVIIFDEFFSVTKSDHEFRAFEDFMLLYKTDIKFIPIGKTRSGQFAIKLT